jgi:hypothetical protein
MRRAFASAGPLARAVALLPLGAYGVHQLRYALVPDTEVAGAHGYLVAAPLALALLGAVLVARCLSRWARAASVAPRVGAWRASALSAVALLGVYVAQELIEAALTPGAPLPLSAGGWVAVPLAAAFGALIGLALRVGAVGAGALAGRLRAARAPLRRARSGLPAAHLAPARAPRNLLARRLAGRAPPVAA